MKHDIIIVGSGPAGTSTALHLAQSNPALARRILILERARHPRPKLCGGGILEDGETILRNLGLDLTAVPHADVLRPYFTFEGRGICIVRKPVSFRVVARDAFDAWLAAAVRAAGITIQEETRVRSVRSTPDGVVLETDRGRYEAEVVVGADGSNSVVRRAVSRGADGHVARVLEFYVPPGADRPPQPQEQTQAYFDYRVIGEGVQGYVWNFPMLLDGKPARNYGIFDLGMYDYPRRDLTPILRQAVARAGLNLDDYRVQGHPIRWFAPDGTLAAPRILLVGDAAGVDPSYGEGISFSLGYGALAAQELNAAFARRDFAFGDYRDRILKSRMGISLKRRYGLARWLYGIRSVQLQRLIWWRFGFLLRWYVGGFLIAWAR